MLPNGDFLRPAPPSGTFIILDSGERYGVWRVAGSAGNVTFVNGSYTHHGLSFLAQGTGNDPVNHAWANLAGISQTATGLVHAPIATVQGNLYTLSFWVGNMYAPNDVYGTSSTVNVYENSTLLGTYTNSGGQGTNTENWQYFTVTFAADAPFTTIAFMNGDPQGDMNCGLDNVLLLPAGQKREQK
jgi:hypothetical protein